MSSNESGGAGAGAPGGGSAGNVAPRRVPTAAEAAVLEAVNASENPLALLQALLGSTGGSFDGESSLLAACRLGNERLVSSLLSAKASVNKPNKSGATPLVASSIRGNTGIVSKLLEAKADVNHQTTNGDSPLSLATWKNRVDTALALLDAKADATRSDRYGDTALHDAAKGGDPRLIRRLIACDGVRVNKKNNAGATPLEKAVRARNLKAVRILLEARSIVTKNVLGLAKGNPEMKELLDEFQGGVIPSMKDEKFLKYLSDGGKIDGDAFRFGDNDDTCLILAARAGRLDLVEAITEKFPKEVNRTNKSGSTPVIAAAMRGHTGICERLVECKANLNVRTAKGDSAVSLAVWKNHAETTIALLESGADPTNRDSYGDTLLHDVANNGNVDLLLDIVDYLDDMPAPKAATDEKKPAGDDESKTVAEAASALEAIVGARNNKDMSPLCSAIRKGNTQVVRVLLDLGAVIGDTELSLSFSKPKIKSILLAEQRRRTDPLVPEVTDQDLIAQIKGGKRTPTPLLVAQAATAGNTRVLRALLQASGETLDDKVVADVLATAASGGNVGAVRALLEYNKASAQGKRGTEALAKGIRSGSCMVCIALLEAGSDPNGTVKIGSNTDDAKDGKDDTQPEIEVGAQPSGITGPLIHLALEARDTVVMSFLLDSGADANAKDSSGKTPLHRALGQKDVSKRMLSLLIENGAKIDRCALDMRGLD